MKNLIAQIGLLAGAWVTFITTFKDFVELVSKFSFVMSFMSEKWIILGYLIFLYMCCFVGMYLNNKLIIEESKIAQNSFEDASHGDYDKTLSSALKRIELKEKIKIVTSFGLVWFIDKVLSEKYQIHDIDEFSKPSYWENFSNNQDPLKIIRATIKDEKIELRFRKDHFKILMRKTIDEQSNYGEFQEKDFNWKEFSYLLFICPLYLLRRLAFN